MTIDPTAFRSIAQASTHPYPCPGRPIPIIKRVRAVC
jgi:hypothetical protein